MVPYDSSGSARRYHFFDGMGSTSELTNESGTELGTYTYDAWGNQLSGPSLTNPFRFIGKYGYYYGGADSMYLLQQRYYRANIGRFWTRDPIGDLGDTNPYRYVHNRPTVGVDPSGLRQTYKVTVTIPSKWPPGYGWICKRICSEHICRGLESDCEYWCFQKYDPASIQYEVCIRGCEAWRSGQPQYVGSCWAKCKCGLSGGNSVVFDCDMP